MKRSWTIYILLGGLTLVLITLGVLQYRALTDASEADAEKARRRVQEETERFAADFNREIQNAYFNFQTEDDVWKTKNWQPFIERYDYWRDKTSYPELISGFYFFTTQDETMPLVYDRDQRAFVTVEMTSELADIQKKAVSETGFRPFLIEHYTLLLPIHEAGSELEKIVIRRTKSVSGEVSKPMVTMPNRYGFLAIKLNEAVVKEQLLSDLSAKYFGEGEFRAAVTDTAGQPVYQSLNGDSSDATAKLFTLSPDNFIEFKNKELLDSIGAERKTNVIVNSRVESKSFDQRIVSGDGKAQTFSIELRDSKPRTPVLARISDAGDAPWTLAVQHSSGSIAGYAASTLRRNLAIGFGLLFLLAAAVTAIVFSAMRAKMLARRQIEFVSSVSHEFRTPLAVIYSAGENLVDGVAKDNGQVERYGSVIKGEGKKLSAMVEQILEFAGANSGRRKFNFAQVSVDEIVNDALDECRPLIEQANFAVEKNISPTLPLIHADKATLSQAIQNLVVNSIKYGDSEAWLRVSVEYGDRKIRISVEDRGIGIARKDIRSIFEPFYRSKEVVDAQIHGNGLGLSLVKQIAEAHGGRAFVSSEIGKGSKFTIELPSL
ncbi:MAG: sensor histidine kinase [Pyrinomonadaceae bacterium]